MGGARRSAQHSGETAGCASRLRMGHFAAASRLKQLADLRRRWYFVFNTLVQAPTQVKLWRGFGLRSPCSMSLDVADPHAKAVRSIAVSAGLWCTFINQSCSEVSLTTRTTNQTIPLEKYLSGVGMRPALQTLHEPDSSQEFTRLTTGWRAACLNLASICCSFNFCFSRQKGRLKAKTKTETLANRGTKAD